MVDVVGARWVVQVRQTSRHRWELDAQLVRTDGTVVRNPYWQGPRTALTRGGACRRATRWARDLQRQQLVCERREAVPAFTVLA